MLVVTKEWGPSDAQHRQVTIRFPHVDHAGIMFYPRYIEILHENFPRLPLYSPPVNFQIEFLRPNRLGDRRELVSEQSTNSAGWSVSGKMDEQDCFVIKSADEVTPTLASDAHQVHTNAYMNGDQVVGEWSVDRNSQMYLSRYFELLNIAVEEWFEDTLQMPFYRLHVEHQIGIPTATFSTRCRALPNLGDTISLWVQPMRIGQRSMTARSWLVRGDECLIETQQVIVFVRMLEKDYETVVIPDDVRIAFQSKMDN